MFSTAGAVARRGEPVLLPFGEWPSGNWTNSIPQPLRGISAYLRATGSKHWLEIELVNIAFASTIGTASASSGPNRARSKSR